MANDFVFTEEEMAVDEGLGYPKAFGKLCRDRSFGPYSHGPPYAFNPYSLVQQEEARANELDEMFPVIDPKAKPTIKPKIFSSLLWKQLNHLGNAGFNPEIIRIDPYGNVLYYHADDGSPLAWEIDHVFPCSRGGFTVPSNLRILQWQICRRKHNKLEFLIPWWDLQLGISINQFLSIFASSNSDFRRRAFSWLFSEGESEELNASQTVDSHIFPQHFLESEGRLGLAPAAVFLTKRDPFDAPLKSLDLNRRPRSNTPIIAAVKKGKHLPTENESARMVTNPYQAIVMARDSLKQKEEAGKMQAEIHKLDNEVCELQQKAEEDKLSIQELELVLIKKRRRAEKCRWLVESQSTYRTMLEKMIKDASHQSVVYKEQVRLNQAAASALLARLEAQKAICDSTERELYMKFKHRDELEKQIRLDWEQARKRSRMDDALIEGRHEKSTLCLPGTEQKMLQEIEESDNSPDTNSAAHSQKGLRKFLKDKLRASAATLLENEESKEEELEGEKETTKIRVLKPDLDKTRGVVAKDDGYTVDVRVEKLDSQDAGTIWNIQFPFPCESEEREDEESRKQRGKGNLDKWMQFLLENTHEEEEDEESRRQRGKGNIEKWTQFLLENTIEDAGITPRISDEKETTKTDELIGKINTVYPHIDIKDTRAQNPQCKETAEVVEEKMGGQSVVSDVKDENNTGGNAELKDKKPISDGDKESDSNMPNISTPFKKPACRKGKGGRTSSLDETAKMEKIGKGRGLVRSESDSSMANISTPFKKLFHVKGKEGRTSSLDENAKMEKIGKETGLVVEEKMEGQSVVSDIRDESSAEMKDKKPISDGDKESDSSIANISTPFKKLAHIKGKGGRTSSLDENAKMEKGLVRSESARAFRRIPSSPSLLLEGMKKRVDCIGRRKPLVLDDNDGGEKAAPKNSFIKSSIKTIKKALGN